MDENQMNPLLLHLLAVDPPWEAWSIPWAGIGATLLGVGGTLSGIAAIITARNRGRDEGAISTTVSRPDVDDRSGILDSNGI
jgi:hypothetical protein